MKHSTLSDYIHTVKLFNQSAEFSNWLISIAPEISTTQSQTVRHREHYLPGCQNPVWITGEHQNGSWRWSIDSDSKFTLGVGKILQDVYNGMTTEQVAQTKYHDFKPIAQAMSVVRQRGLQMMINRIHTIADHKDQAQ